MPHTTRRHTSKPISHKTLGKHSKLLSVFIAQQNHSELCPSQITKTQFICVVSINIKLHSVQTADAASNTNNTPHISNYTRYNPVTMHLKHIEHYFINNTESPFRQPTARPIKTAQPVRPRPVERNSTIFNTGEIYRIKCPKRQFV